MVVEGLTSIGGATKMSAHTHHDREGKGDILQKEGLHRGGATSDVTNVIGSERSGDGNGAVILIGDAPRASGKSNETEEYEKGGTLHEEGKESCPLASSHKFWCCCSS